MKVTVQVDSEPKGPGRGADHCDCGGSSSSCGCAPADSNGAGGPPFVQPPAYAASTAAESAATPGNSPRSNGRAGFRSLDIALINMPWARSDTPSIACGILKAVLEAAGHRVRTYYLNLELSRRLGATAYENVWHSAEERRLLLGDWLFGASGALGASSLSDEEYLARYAEELMELECSGLTRSDLLTWRNVTLPGWVDECARSIEWDAYDIVGFTSTFAQNMASCALATRIRHYASNPCIVFGGANCDDEMGAALMSVCGAIDCTVSGEGEQAFLALAERLGIGADFAGIQGVAYRRNGEVVPGGQAPKVADMDSQPFPDYSEYFEFIATCDEKSVMGERKLVLPIETARGCWWGAKHHCTFCGLNGSGMAFRSKSPARALEEIGTLSSRYQTRLIAAVDNIMDMRYLGSLCHELRESKWDLEIFFEVKANLSRQQLRALRDAGITQLQPGLESLSTNVLGIMRKGTTLLNNVRFLKWCSYYGIDVYWNILNGLPGETDHDFEDQIEIIPSLWHLTPPVGFGRLWLERFSPYLQGNVDIVNVRPLDAYRYVYEGTGDTLARLAYFFDYEARNIASEEVTALLRKSVGEWREKWSRRPRPMLLCERGNGWISIVDTRGDTGIRHSFDGWRASAYEFCLDKPHPAELVGRYLTERGDLGDANVEAFFDECTRRRLMIAEDGYYFSLAVPKNPNW
jgi:ribosomal peptide maturation radical SAM protein 1